MSPHMSLTILPLLVLYRICEFVAQPADDELKTRLDLWSFTLTSKACCAVAEPHRFCQVALRVINSAQFENVLNQWTDMLKIHNRSRHVRRLKIRWVSEEQERHERADTARKLRGEQADPEADIRYIQNTLRDWERRQWSHLPEFCCQEYSYYPAEHTMNHDEAWRPLVDFMARLTGLEDFVWKGGWLPPYILSAVEDAGCRLHMPGFYLPSLWQERGSPRPIERDEHAIATSPSLRSIKASVPSFDDLGRLNYLEDAIMQMVAGAAPGLAHVALIGAAPSDSPASREARRLGKPGWLGFFPINGDAGPAGKDACEQALRGSLQSLYLNDCIRSPAHWMEWSLATNFSNLRSLSLGWRSLWAEALAETFASGQFTSLEELTLWSIEHKSSQSEVALNTILQHSNTLRHLDLDGAVSSKAFDIVLDRHVEALISLAVNPHRGRDDDGEALPKMLVVFSQHVVERVAERCRNLERINITIPRTRGNEREIGIYRALGRLPRLRRAYLRLQYAVGLDVEDGSDRNNEKDQEQTISDGTSSSSYTIYFVHLREAFSNCAVDSSLALSIFDLISAGTGKLESLVLMPTRKTTLYTMSDGMFDDFLAWLGRQWVCQRERNGSVTAHEVNKQYTARCCEEWQEEAWPGEPLDVFSKVFWDIWPRERDDWWNDWKSLSLAGN